jgi:hypothetical protein
VQSIKEEEEAVRVLVEEMGGDVHGMQMETHRYIWLLIAATWK